MSVSLHEPIPHTNVEAARLHFDYFGHVSLDGLIDPQVLEPAIADAARLSSPLKTHNRGNETVTHLRQPDARREAPLTAVLQGMQNGALLLGKSVLPVFPTEALHLELLEMERNHSGSLHRYDRNFLGAVAVTNLRGESNQKIYGEKRGRSVDYLIRPGVVVIHNRARSLWHRDSTAYDSTRHAAITAATVLRPSPAANR